MSAHASSEEIWNQKQLAKAVGTSVAAARSASGGPRPLHALEASLRIAPGCWSRFVEPHGGLRGWLAKHHASDFIIADSPDGTTTVALTDAGAAKYALRDVLSETVEAPAAEPDSATRAAREAVFTQLAQAAAERCATDDDDWLTRAVGRAKYVRFYACSQASTDAAEAWRPRASDVIVATYSKTGTTLLQQLIQMLRSGGDMGFDEITAVQPWPDFCADCRVELDAPQPHWPRVFKSHQRPAALNRGARVASVVREPRQVVASYYSFYVAKDHPLVRGKSLDAWAAEWADVGTSNGTLWEYYVQLWLCRAAVGSGSAAPLLLFEYAALASALPSHARRAAAWLGAGGGGELDGSEENVLRAARLASRESMSAAAAQFDDHYLNAMQTAAGSEHVMQGAAKVRPEAAARPTLSAESEALLERMWRERVAPRTGLASYAELAARLAEDHAPWV